jgi:hypothetical protein
MVLESNGDGTPAPTCAPTCSTRSAYAAARTRHATILGLNWRAIEKRILFSRIQLFESKSERVAGVFAHGEWKVSVHRTLQVAAMVHLAIQTHITRVTRGRAGCHVH